MSKDTDRVVRLLDEAGRTYAAEAGIRLADIAVAAARELVRSGFGTPRRMLEATWQQRVDDLVRVDLDKKLADRVAS